MVLKIGTAKQEIRSMIRGDITGGQKSRFQLMTDECENHADYFSSFGTSLEANKKARYGLGDPEGLN